MTDSSQIYFLELDAASYLYQQNYQEMWAISRGATVTSAMTVFRFII